MSKTLQKLNVTEYIDMAHRFDNVSQTDLEQMRQSSEVALRHESGVNKVAAALKQSIAANSLNERFGKSYPVADFDEHGQVFMRQNEGTEAVSRSSNRRLPSCMMEESAEMDNGFSL